METFGTALPSDPKLALVAVFVAGLLSVFTPCVLPMLPITLATLGVTRAQSRWTAFTTAASYVVGIVLTFTVLGVVFAFTGTLFGALLGHPVTAVLLALVFVALAASCFEILPFQLPSRVTQRMAKIGGRGPLGAFAAGLVAGFLAAPCIGPILAAILSYVTVTRDVGYGAVLLATYGLGFGLPFLLVGAFALRLPKAGQWMEAVKGMFGILLLVGAFWVLRGAFAPLRFQAALPTALVAFGSASLMFLIFAARDHERPVLKTIFATLAVVSGCMIVNALLAPKLLDWCKESPETGCIAQSQALQSPAVILFTGAWCTACHELEAGALSDPRVKARLSRYNTVLVDVDVNPELTETYKASGVPLVVMVDKDGKVRGGFHDKQDAEFVLKWLDEMESAP